MSCKDKCYVVKSGGCYVRDLDTTVPGRVGNWTDSHTRTLRMNLCEAKKLASENGGRRVVRLLSKKKAVPKERFVLVTTAHRGVFAGFASDIDGDVIALRQARLCVYWSADCKGFMGLAANGPTADCRIGPPADIKLRNITAVLTVTDAARAAWEAQPWRS